ncbi:MAG TPA: carboxypeptidase-like regulatory domain-containing protein, partial [Polyangia bacterium]|nr:carboxypeptidase-like regulatory domain-containing protein [Polyangia bacterium]
MDFASRRNPIVLLAVPLTVLLVCAAGAGGGACAKRRPGRAKAPAPAAGALAVVDGRVLTASGDPLGEATVRLEWDDPIGARSADRVPLATVRASADGRFHIGNVPPGRYRLRAHAPEHADGRVRIDVHAGDSLATS